MYSKTNVRAMCEGALCIALSIVLSKLNIFEMPQGGSVDLELVPLILFAYRRGIKWGVGAAALDGLLKILLGGYVYNPIQAIVDYPLAYAFAGLAAITPRIAGLIIAAVGQIACHVISGVIFFSQYAPEGQSPFIYSLLYNTPVISVKYLISGIVALLLWKALEKALPEA